VPSVRLVIDLFSEEHGRRRAERVIDLPAVPRQGEAVWIAPTLALMVKSVSWNLAREEPMLFLGRSEGTPASVVEHEGELTIHESYVEHLAAAGWGLTQE
jgi:hypothetical protein